MKSLDVLVGHGEIGQAVRSIITDDVYVYDIHFGQPIKQTSAQVRLLHICIPYTKDFIKQVKGYQKFFSPQYTVIHSTVPVGTSRKLRAVHSPVMGMHPNMELAVKTFTKFFGGASASFVADMFRRYGMNVYVTDKSETTELMKILCTTNYGLNIEFTKEVKRLCDQYKVPFEMFTVWNNAYNSGNDKLGYPQYHRYNLVPLMKDIGGHCVLNNYKLLKSKFIDFLESIK